MSRPAHEATSAEELTRAERTGRPGAARRALLGVAAAVLAGLCFAAGWWVARPTFPGETSPDAGFSRDMQAHHAQAVDMAMTVRSAGVTTSILTLSYDIATTQENQRGQMSAWLQTWGLPQARSEDPMAWMARAGHTHGGSSLSPDGRMPGMATPAQISRLRALRGAPAEVLFLQLMIPHHRGGVDMARACVSSCRQPEVVAFARNMVEGQTSEIGLMTRLLRERGGSVPAG